jgi:Sulfotransferase family/Aspartyl/Asparaginyl beta-hydroxylase
MRLPQPFFRLPRQFDAERLRDEVAAIPAAAWAPHPNGIAGNSSVRLISVDGQENDLVEGVMSETAHLQYTPYIRQVLAGFNVPWSRTRLLRLAPGAGVPVHADINYHWYYRVRLHIPVITRPEVRFHCDGVSVHMAAGEAWVFDNWRLHNVENPTTDERIHLVADTAGSAAFWQLVGAGSDEPNIVNVEYRPGSRPALLTERNISRPVMNHAELEMLVGNLRSELLSASDTIGAHQQLARYHGLLDAFVRDWRQAYVQYGEDPAGRHHFTQLRDTLRIASRPASEGIVLRTNRVAAHQVLEGRVLRACVVAIEPNANVSVQRAARAAAVAAAAAADNNLTRPVFIMAAPRSGSSLLFETLASSDQIVTLGGEAHWLIETIAELAPGAPGVDSNRLLAAQATPAIIERIRSQILERLVDRRGERVLDAAGRLFLEKTPKNALRIPFLNRIFPDARFIFLWREPRGNLSSIMEAWKSGKWQTYPMLDGFEPPWSLLLPPGWQEKRGKPLAELAAFQWNATNTTVLDDLAAIPESRWTSVAYGSFLSNPAAVIRRLCAFLGMDLDASLQDRLKMPLPAARHTLTAPDPDKWKRNEAEIERIMPQLDHTWRRLIDIADPDAKRSEA